jgi:hypothetical protein
MTAGELPPEKGGCLRIGLIGCGIVALLCILIFAGGLLFVKKNPGALMDFALRGIEHSYGPDVTEEDKKELRAAIEDFKEAIRSNRTRSDSSTAFNDDAGDLFVAPGRLPARVGEVGHPGDVPNATAVNPVTTNAIPIEKTGDDDLFLFRTAHPEPRTSHLRADLTIRAGFAPLMPKEGSPRRGRIRVRRKVSEIGEPQDQQAPQDRRHV